MATDPFYLSREWRRFRAWFLRHNPSCSVPGCRTPATHVDHEVARRAGGADFDPLNCRSFCASHHNQKTAYRDRPTMKRSSASLKAAGCSADGMPLDPKHVWNTR